jgi:hypothetical protein
MQTPHDGAKGMSSSKQGKLTIGKDKNIVSSVVNACVKVTLKIGYF